MNLYKYKFLIIYFCCIFFQNFYSQNIEIEGKSKFPETLVELYLVKTIFSPYQEKIQETKTDANGNFSLTFTPENQYEKIAIKINAVQTKFWIKKEDTQTKKYQIIFPKLKKEINPNQYLTYTRAVQFVYLADQEPEREIKNADQFQIEIHKKYKKYWDYFLFQEGDLAPEDSLRKRKVFFQTLKAENNLKNNENNENDFIKNYYLFMQAQEALLLQLPLTSIYDDYLKPLERIPNYDFFYVFFEKFYKKFIDQPSFLLYKEKYLKALNSKQSIKKIEDILSGNSFLKKENLRLLFLAMNLKDLFLQKKITISVFLTYLEALKNKQSSLPQLDEIIKSYEQNWITMSVGRQIPTWSLITQNIKSTQNYFLFFTNSKCLECLTVLDLIEKNEKKLNFKVAIVYLGEEKTAPLPYKNTTIPILFTENQTLELIKNWKIIEVPLFLLAQTDGKILAYPAFGPLPDGHGRTWQEYEK